ncbi:MAG: hypothetical protein GEU28_04625 [Dehalococcoidia bacterium]|nr:hypothetical protein [Dehalococcoidia bacterium]
MRANVEDRNPKHEIRSTPGGVTPSTNIGDLIDRHPGVLEVLERYGIRIDPATYILLRGTVQQAAEFNAILDIEGFRAALAESIQAESAASFEGDVGR